MAARTRRVVGRESLLLSQGWMLCRTAPGSVLDPIDLAAHTWVAADACGTVGGIERAADRWSLDCAPIRFDAFDWWYRLHFDGPHEVGTEDVILGFDGLATLAEVWLNGSRLFESTSMFVASEHAVGGRLLPKSNELLILFRSLDMALTARRPRPRWRTPMVENQQLRWFRTTPLGRMPGWSPPCAVVGPWRDIWLETRRGLALEGLRIRAEVDGDLGVLALVCRFAGEDGVASAAVELRRNGATVSSPLSPVKGEARHWRARAIVPDVDLWWPHTHGDPALYSARLIVQRVDREELVIDIGSVGFRTIRLDTENGDFSVSVNGVPVFCRGACWTPLDPVTLRAQPQQYRRAVSQVRAAGMNMLRVSGTMVYEDDSFLDACDEQGVLLWHDFMFANMDFPDADDAFADLVRTEVLQQLSRLQGRPSLAIVCGNSEVAQQAAMWGAPRELWGQALFGKVIPELVKQELPGTPYWPSSAWGGAFPHQVDSGTTSYYGVGAYLRPQEDARRSGLRFATEALAFANVPSVEAIARIPGGLTVRVTHPAWKARAPRDLGAGWDFEDVRDHYLAELFGVDPGRLRYDDHDRYLTLSRVTTGEVMANAFAEWRRHGSSCRGALVWFLRDLWAGAGWGLLDDVGQPKACWHALARVLQPRTVVLTDEGNNGLVAHAINERDTQLDVQLGAEAWRGDVCTNRCNLTLTLEPRSVRPVPLLSLTERFVDFNHAFRFGALAHDAVVVTLRDVSGSRLAQAFHFPGGLGLPQEADLGLAATASELEDGRVLVRLSTRRLAVAVHFDTPGYCADAEYFHVVPQEEHFVVFRLVDTSKRQFRGSVHAINALGPVSIKHAS